MGYFKIKNITNLLPKRHAKINTIQSIEIVDSFKAQKFDISPDEEFILESNFLPIHLHKLRSEGLISVIEMDKNSYHAVINEQSKKKLELQQPENKDVEESAEEKTKKSTMKVFKKDK